MFQRLVPTQCQLQTKRAEYSVCPSGLKASRRGFNRMTIQRSKRQVRVSTNYHRGWVRGPSTQRGSNIRLILSKWRQTLDLPPTTHLLQDHIKRYHIVFKALQTKLLTWQRLAQVVIKMVIKITIELSQAKKLVRTSVRAFSCSHQSLVIQIVIQDLKN